MADVVVVVGEQSRQGETWQSRILDLGPARELAGLPAWLDTRWRNEEGPRPEGVNK